MNKLAKALQAAAGNAGNPNAWDISKAYYDAGSDAWDLSKAFYTSVTKLLQAQDTAPQGLFFKPDGTRMYVSDSTSDRISEYSLSTPWDIRTLVFVRSKSIVAQANDVTDIFFKADGTQCWVTSLTFGLLEYNLSTAWDISTASFVQSVVFGTSLRSVYFREDGLKFYLIGFSPTEMKEYSLSTAWDISTASYVQSFASSAKDTNPQYLTFKPDGTAFYFGGSGSNSIHKYNLATAWDLSTASFVQSYNINQSSPNAYGLFFRPDGSTFFTVDVNSDSVLQFAIGGFSVTAQSTNPVGLFFKPDGTKMYVVDSPLSRSVEYNLSTAWDVTTASFSQFFSYTLETAPRTLFFKPDGTKLYILGVSGDDVNELSLSIPWDISTASYVQVFSVAAQETLPTALFFKPDGTKMYVSGLNLDSVHEYNLSTAWDISTSSYLQTFSVVSQETAPTGLFFKPNGTKMYLIGSTGDSVYEYNLSTAWDISTASYVQSFFIAQDTLPSGVFWKDDGTQFWVTGANLDKVSSYLISSE